MRQMDRRNAWNQESGTRKQRLSACCGAFGDDGYMCPSPPGVADVVYCCDKPTLRQFNDGTPTNIGTHKGCMKVVVPPTIVEKENDATVVDSFMTDIDSVYAEVADGQQPKHKKSGVCGLDAQAEWAKHPNKYAEEKERCMCMNQKCCGGYNKCEKNRATCTSNGFNCVQQSSFLEDIFVDVTAPNVCDLPKYSNICALPDDDLVAIQVE